MPLGFGLNRAKGMAKLHMRVCEVAYATFESCICNFWLPYRGFDWSISGVQTEPYGGLREPNRKYERNQGRYSVEAWPCCIGESDWNFWGQGPGVGYATGRMPVRQLISILHSAFGSFSGLVENFALLKTSLGFTHFLTAKTHLIPIKGEARLHKCNGRFPCALMPVSVRLLSRQ